MTRTTRQCVCGHIHPGGTGVMACTCGDCHLLWTTVPRHLLKPESRERLDELEAAFAESNDV